MWHVKKKMSDEVVILYSLLWWNLQFIRKKRQIITPNESQIMTLIRSMGSSEGQFDQISEVKKGLLWGNCIRCVYYFLGFQENSHTG